MPEVKEYVWNRDGHRVLVLIDWDKITIALEYCPNGGREGTDCWHPEAKGCLVRAGIKLFGFEANRGMAPGLVFDEISWAFVPGPDLYMSEFVFMPVADEKFRDFFEEQMTEEGEE